MADRRVTAPATSRGGKFRAGSPRVIVIHDLEAPARAGMAYSLATGWLQNERVSIHAIADPGEVVEMVPIDTVAWHCGNGNSFSLGIEHTGYAAWTFDQWTDPTAFKALRNGARKVAEWCKALDIPMVWLSPAEVVAGKRGLATHNTMRLGPGGTTHTDPNWNAELSAIYLRMVQDFAGVPRIPDPEPTPAPGPQTGGAQADWLDMATEDDLRRIIREEMTALNLPAQIIEGVWRRDENDPGSAISIKSSLNTLLDEYQK